MDTFIKRDSPKSVPEVGKVSVDEARLSEGVDASSRFSDLSCEVEVKILLELLLVPHVFRDVGHHNSSVADPLMLVVYPHHRINGRLEGILRVGVPILSCGPIEEILGGSKEIDGSHPHEADSYPPKRHHPSDRDPEYDDDVNPKEGLALRGIRQRRNRSSGHGCWGVSLGEYNVDGE